MSFIRMLVCFSLCSLFLMIGGFASGQVAGTGGWQGPDVIGAVSPIGDISRHVPGKTRFCLLRTSYLLEGELDPAGTHYIVKTEYGSMRIPVSNIEFVGSSREEVFRYKAGQVDLRNHAEMVKQAEWCFRNGFREEGFNAYEQAKTTAPNQMMADMIARKIDLLNNPVPDDKSVHGISASGMDAGESEKDEELDRWTEGLPGSVVEMYIRKVQPILTSRCASAQCHGFSSENEFKIRIPRQNHGRTTYRNLRESIRWVNLDHPSASPLIQALVTTHGGKKPLYDVESVPYDNFIEWIQLAVKDLPPELNDRLMEQVRNRQGTQNVPMKPTMVTETLPKGYRDALAARQQASNETRVPPSFFASNPATDRTNPSTAAPIRYTPTRLVVPEKTEEKPISETDPFDPNRFNEKYHGRKGNYP